MSDLLEHDLRDAYADRAARMTPGASARLRAVDYHPRSRRLASRRLLGGLGLSGAAAIAGAAVLLGSSAAPAFAGWRARPTVPLPDQLRAADQQCGTGEGTPVLTDTRGPYTASIYADGSTCIEGNGITIAPLSASAGLLKIPHTVYSRLSICTLSPTALPSISALNVPSATVSFEESSGHFPPTNFT